MVGADPGGRVRLERTAEHAGGVAVDVLRQLELRELGRVAGDDAGEVHHLGEPDHTAAAEERVEVADREGAPRRLEVRCGDARRRHEVDVERKPRGGVEQPVDAVGAEHVRDLVRIGDDGRRPERQDEACELVGEHLRRLDVDVGIDESRDDPLARGVDDLVPLVLAEPRDPAADDCDIRLEPLACEHRQHLAAPDHEVGGLVAARDGKTLRKDCVHGARTVPFVPWTS